MTCLDDPVSYNVQRSPCETAPEEPPSMDHVAPDQRSQIMSKVPSVDTSPELVVRKMLHRSGYRYRLHSRKLPGKPDIVLPRLRVVIFVHGCFWHGHQNCQKGQLPKSRVKYWRDKIQTNQERDHRSIGALEEAHWRVGVVWQCQTKDRRALAHRLTAIVGGPVSES